MKLNLTVRRIFSLVAFIAILGSCTTMNRSRMLKTPRDYEFAEFPDSSIYEAYKISPDDIIRLRIYSNDGFKPLSIGSIGQNQNQNQNNLFNSYRVQHDGTVKIPVLGDFKISGYSIQQAEELIENMLEKFYNSPFVILEVTNKRVYLFQGGNQASVINLNNDNTTLFEVLAQAGGISQNSNAKKIKIIRGNLREPTIYLIDLSKVESLEHTNLIMQADDIIYIDPVINFANSITADIGSILGLISSTLLIANIATNNN